MWWHTFNTSTWESERWKKADLYESQASQSYIVSFRPARTTQCDPVSKTNKKKNTLWNDEWVTENQGGN